MAPKGSTTRRGYGSKHQKARRYWAKLVDAGTAYCSRCGRWLPPGCEWDLGHDDNDRAVYTGPECVRCNRGAPGRAAGVPCRFLPEGDGTRTRRGWYSPSGTGPCSWQWAEDYFWVGPGEPPPGTALAEWHENRRW